MTVPHSVANRFCRHLGNRSEFGSPHGSGRLTVRWPCQACRPQGGSTVRWRSRPEYTVAKRLCRPQSGSADRKAALPTAKPLCRRLTRHLRHLYDLLGGRRVGSPSRRCAASSNPLSAEGGRFGSTPEFRSRTRLAGSPRKKRGSRGYPGVWLRQSRFATARRFYHRFLEFGV